MGELSLSRLLLDHSEIRNTKTRLKVWQIWGGKDSDRRRKRSTSALEGNFERFFFSSNPYSHCAVLCTSQAANHFGQIPSHRDKTINTCNNIARQYLLRFVRCAPLKDTCNHHFLRQPFFGFRRVRVRCAHFCVQKGFQKLHTKLCKLEDYLLRVLEVCSQPNIQYRH